MPTAMAEWFDRVFNDPVYLQLYESEDTRRAGSEVQGAMRLCDGRAGGRWLDACCGFGRHAEGLAARGLDVVGVDRAPLMIARARARAAHCAPVSRPAYVRADIRYLPFAEQFDCVSLFFDSFGYFASDREHLDALASLALALRPHGRLLIHSSNREDVLAHWVADRTEERAGCRVRHLRELDLPRGRQHWVQHIDAQDGRHTWEFDLRLFAASELAEMLRVAGFDDIAFYGDWQGGSYGPSSPAMIARARKAVLSDWPELAG